MSRIRLKAYLAHTVFSKAGESKQHRADRRRRARQSKYPRRNARCTSTNAVARLIEALRKKTEATGTKDKAVVEAEGESEALLKKAKAEAEANKLKLLAQAEGEVALAEALKLRMAAETAHLQALNESGAPEVVQVAWVLRDQYAGIIEADAQKWEHINLGEVKVIGDSNAAANFMGGIMKTVEAARSIAIPGLTGVLNKLGSFDEKTSVGQLKGGTNKPSVGAPDASSTTVE